MAEGDPAHAGHDPEIIAALLDGDLTGAELARAQVMVVACPSCAALHADLLALSIATRAQEVPARPRDFRLTVADAERLRSEPEAAGARLTDVMTDLPTTSSHASHDLTLVASLADHSLATSERAAAETLVATCRECATLRADLELLVAATRAMPTPPRPISYTLTRGQAARLRPNPWRRLVAATGTARDGFTRPLAIGLTALGLVGLMVSSMPPIGFGGAASSAASEAPPALEAAPAPGGGVSDTTGQTDPGAAVVPGDPGDTTISAPSGPDRLGGSAAPVFGITSGESRPAASGAAAADGAGKGAAVDTAEPSPQDRDGTTQLTATAPASEVSLLPLVSVALLLMGLALFVLRWGARRRTDG